MVAGTADGHEGMVLRFEGVRITRSTSRRVGRIFCPRGQIQRGQKILPTLLLGYLEEVSNAELNGGA